MANLQSELIEFLDKIQDRMAEPLVESWSAELKSGVTDPTGFNDYNVTTSEGQSLTAAQKATVVEEGAGEYILGHNAAKLSTGVRLANYQQGTDAMMNLGTSTIEGDKKGRNSIERSLKA